MNTLDKAGGFSLKRTAFLFGERVRADISLIALCLGILVAVEVLSIGITGSVISFSDSELFLSSVHVVDLAFAWLIFAVVVGILLASRSFTAMHGNASTDWLLLPVNPLERFAAVVLWVCVVWPLVALLVGGAITYASMQQAQLLEGYSPELVNNILLMQVVEFIGQFWSVVCFMLAGSALFRNKVLLKSFALMLLIFVLFGLFIFLQTYLSGSSDAPDAVSFINGYFYITSDSGAALVRANRAQVLFDFWRYMVIPICSLFFAFFRMREKEAVDALQ